MSQVVLLNKEKKQRDEFIGFIEFYQDSESTINWVRFGKETDSKTVECGTKA